MVDATVFIGAANRPMGIERGILHGAGVRYQLCTTPGVVREVGAQDIPGDVALSQEGGTHPITVGPFLDGKVPSEVDAGLVASALANGCRFIISDDRDVKRIRDSFAGTGAEVLTARQFAFRFQGGGRGN